MSTRTRLAIAIQKRLQSTLTEGNVNTLSPRRRKDPVVDKLAKTTSARERRGTKAKQNNENEITTPTYENHSLAQLKQLCKERQLSVNKPVTKNRMIELLQQADLLDEYAKGDINKKKRTACVNRNIDSPNVSSGTRFRLINVVLNAAFATRWSCMDDLFWHDVHTAYRKPDALYGRLHFQDDRFVNISVQVIDQFSAHRLQQIWEDIVHLYSQAVRQATNAVSPEPFVEYCGDRIDLLYLHMGLRFEPQLSTILLNDKESNQITTTLIINDQEHIDVSPKKKARRSSLSVPRTVQLDNPTMLPAWLIEDQAQMAAARGELLESGTQKQALPPKRSRRAAIKTTPVKPSATLRNINVPAQLSTTTQPTATHTDKVVIGSLDTDNELRSSDCVDELQSVSTSVVTSCELVPRASVAQSQELMVPPDEFDILTNRIRCMNDNIAECYRLLETSTDGNTVINPRHQQDLESDIEFYMMMKKRLQEQLMMVMHGY